MWPVFVISYFALWGLILLVSSLTGTFSKRIGKRLFDDEGDFDYFFARKVPNFFLENQKQWRFSYANYSFVNIFLKATTFIYSAIAIYMIWDSSFPSEIRFMIAAIALAVGNISNFANANKRASLFAKAFRRMESAIVEYKYCELTLEELCRINDECQGYINGTD